MFTYTKQIIFCEKASQYEKLITLYIDSFSKLVKIQLFRWIHLDSIQKS